MKHHLIDHPAAWRSSDFSGPDDFSLDLEPRHLDAMESALERAKARGAALADLTVADFAMPEIADELAELRQLLLEGRGLILIRGFPVDRYGLDDIGMMYWGIGTHLGRGVPQSPMGDRLGYVTDVSKPGERERGYRSAAELRLHTDSDDIVSLLCIRTARSGGMSRLASGYAVYNIMAAERPDLLEPLLNGFRYHWFGEEPPGEPPITDYRVPVFSWAGGVMSICYLREYVELAAQELGEPLSDLEIEALDMFEAVAEREDVGLTFTLNPGEASFINNYTVLHSRTGFEDWPEAERKRLLMRLWLKADIDRPVGATLRRYYGVDGVIVDGRDSTVYDPERRSA